MTDTKFVDKTEYFQCACHSIDCLWAINLQIDKYRPGTKEEYFEKDLYVFMQLNHWMPWYKRLYHGIRYILGMKPLKYSWGETVFQEKDIDRLLALLNEYKNTTSENF